MIVDFNNTQVMQFPDVDPRMAQYPLMDSATTTLVLTLLYLIFVKAVGPAYMKNRKPYNLRKAMILYSFSLVAYSAWMFYKFGKHGWFNKYSWLCEPLTFAVDEDSMGMVYVCWHYYISKFIEFLDTIFFVLRKKEGNVTWLHVIHHSIVPIFAWYLWTHGSTGYNTIIGVVNTFVHIWMYSYYALSAMGPSMQKYLWWKKYLTALQMVQLSVVLIAMLAGSVIPGCQVNAVLVLANVSLCVLLLFLFANFYRHRYQKKKQY